MKLTTIICSLAGLILASAAHAQESLDDCRAIDDDAERLACFDALLAPREAPPPEPAAQPVPRTAPQPTPATAPAPRPAAQPAAAPAPATTARAEVLTDDVGKETLRDEARDELAVHGRVERCVKGRSGKYVFYFDNGQVWRQRGNARARWKECSFDVVISRDAFGYTLVEVGESRKIRIDRVR